MTEGCSQRLISEWVSELLHCYKIVENLHGIFYLTFKLNVPHMLYFILVMLLQVFCVLSYFNILWFFVDNMDESFTTLMTTGSTEMLFSTETVSITLG